MEALDIGDRVVVVLHDWGAVPGLNWARRHAGRLAGLAYMEAMTHPLSTVGGVRVLRHVGAAFACCVSVPATTATGEVAVAALEVPREVPA